MTSAFLGPWYDWAWLVGALVHTTLAVSAIIAMRGRRRSGTAKALWTLIVVVVPFVGPLAYLSATGQTLSGDPDSLSDTA